ncbi:MAG: carbohydrate-binding domain-containing protein, partial [Spirochaetales bacterium]|nr:carbohydrate-binding domain-containing protein [Spirochaetales bacterium]
SCMEPTDEKNTLTVDPESSFTYDINGNVSFFDSTLEEDKENDEKEFKKQIIINFNGAAKPTIEPAKTEGVEIVNSEKGEAHLIIKSSEKINYVLKGESANGSLLIFSQKKFKLTLDNLKLSNDAGVPAISSQTKKRCFIETVGTATIKDAQAYSLPEAYKIKDANGEYVLKDDGKSIACYDAKGAIFSEGEIIFCGNGTLNVEGRNKHAIASDQYVRLLSGTVNVTGSKKDGIHTNDAVLINGGKLDISGIVVTDPNKDVTGPNKDVKKFNGIECEKGYIVIMDGEITIKSPGIGIYASKEEFSKSDVMAEKSFIFINDGKINIETSEAKGHGINSMSHMIIKGGEINIKALGESAKGLRTDCNKVEDEKEKEKEAENGNITLTGGTINIFCVDKALDPEGKLNILGGTINAIGGDCFDREQVLKGSKPCCIATFDSAITKDEEISFESKKVGTVLADLDKAYAVFVKDGLVAGATPEVKIGSQPGNAKVE